MGAVNADQAIKARALTSSQAEEAAPGPRRNLPEAPRRRAGVSTVVCG